MVRRVGAAASAPTPRSTAVAARANTPEPVSCQLAGSRGRWASVKNWLAWVACRIAFQASGPAAVASAPVRITAGWRGRARAARTTPATTADRAAPYRIEAQLSIAGRLLTDSGRRLQPRLHYMLIIRTESEERRAAIDRAAGRLGPVGVAWAINAAGLPAAPRAVQPPGRGMAQAGAPRGGPAG